MATILETFLPKTTTRVVVYRQPINMRWGAEKLGEFCREVLHVEPDYNTCFLFVNRKRDTMLMYFLTSDGDEILMRKLDKGSFILPAPDKEGTPFVIMRPSMRWGKGPRQRLRFTKTGDSKIEEAYSRHFVWPGKKAFPHPALHTKVFEPNNKRIAK